MPCGRARRSLAAGAAALTAALALGACAREAPLEERVRQRLEARDYDGALELLNARIARAPQDEAVKVLRVRVLLVAGRVDPALAEYAALPEEVVQRNAPLARQLAFTLIWEALRSGDGYLESRAAMALAALGDGQALPLFREALAHPNPSVRALALRGLGRVKGDEPAALAEAALRDADGGVRAVAAEALGTLGAAGARPALEAALKDPEPVVRLRATAALALLGDAGARGALRRGIQARPETSPREVFEEIVAAETLARLGDAEGRARLLALLAHPRRSVALFAAEALSNLGDPAPREFLLKVVRDGPDRDNRMWASWTLARLGDGAGAPALVEMLSDRDEHVRLQAAWTLGQMGRLAPLAPLRKALGDPHRMVRYQAAWSMGEVVLAAPPPQGATGG